MRIFSIILESPPAWDVLSQIYEFVISQLGWGGGRELKLNMFVVMTWWRRSWTSSWTSPRRAEESTDPCSLQINMVSCSYSSSSFIPSPFCPARSHHGGGQVWHRGPGPVHCQESCLPGHPVCCCPVRERGYTTQHHTAPRTRGSNGEKTEDILELRDGGDWSLLMFLFEGEHYPSWLHLTRNESLWRRMAESIKHRRRCEM